MCAKESEKLFRWRHAKAENPITISDRTHSMPINPPSADSTTASIKNCIDTSRLRANGQAQAAVSVLPSETADDLAAQVLIHEHLIDPRCHKSRRFCPQDRCAYLGIPASTCLT